MTDMSSQAAGRTLRFGWPLLLLLLVGCSSQGTITGKITFQGKPLPAGIVTFVPEQGGHAVTADIRDGEYKAVKVPVGPVKIAVDTPQSGPPTQFMTKMRPPKQFVSSEDFDKSTKLPKAVPVPKKFNDPNTSGLTYTVKGGPQVHDIDIPAQ